MSSHTIAGITYLKGNQSKTFTVHQELSIQDAAKLSNVSASTVRRWIARGELRAYRYGDRIIRIDLEDLRNMRQEVNPITFDYVNGGGAL